MIGAMFKALGKPTNIEYIDMPQTIRGQYQYFTEARVERLRRAGYNAGFTPLEAAVGHYVTGYLDRDDRYPVGAACGAPDRAGPADGPQRRTIAVLRADAQPGPDEPTAAVAPPAPGRQ